jgi:hypothetical protein
MGAFPQVTLQLMQSGNLALNGVDESNLVTISNSGEATFMYISFSNMASGLYFRSFSDQLVSAQSSQFNVMPDSYPASLTFTTAPSLSLSPQTILDPIPALLVQDSMGNTVTTVGGSTVPLNGFATLFLYRFVDRAFILVPGGLMGTTTVKIINGQAAFPGVSIGTVTAGQNYQLIASSPGLQQATSQTFR